MPLSGKTSEEIERLETQFLAALPKDGSLVSNLKVRDTDLKWELGLYTALKKRLNEQGRVRFGRGRGGMIGLSESVIPEEKPKKGQKPSNSSPYPDEVSLYDPMLKVLKERWLPDKIFEFAAAERTDRGGRRTDGIWSRPDLTVAAMTTFSHIPGRYFDVITFEVKHIEGLNLTAVYEALSHRRAGTRAYVLAYIPDDKLETFQSNTLKDLLEEAGRHGVGLITAGDPADFDTWTEELEAEFVQPSPERLNTFVKNQLSEGTRDQIAKWFKA
ncbi:hypothetical protein [Nisaea sp.]|uniref:hypothetical protein n=1 Tax=Nisaea sp. TaxID=2024842 RepID=UPI003264D419